MSSPEKTRSGLWTTTVALAMALAAAGCSCAPAHPTPDAAPPSDMGVMRDAAHDAPARGDACLACAAPDVGDLDFGYGTDDGACRTGPTGCNTDEDCVLWGMAVGPPGTVPMTACVHHRCESGTTAPCLGMIPGTMCSCGAHRCALDEICVTDAAGGDPYCALECATR